MKTDHEPHGINTGPGEVRLERLLPGPVERIWAYLTDGEKRARWLAAGSTEERVGGKVVLRFRHADLSPERIPRRSSPPTRTATPWRARSPAASPTGC